MRRSDREIKNKQEMLDVMRKCDVCRLAFHLKSTALTRITEMQF